MSCGVGGGSGSGPLLWGLTIILIFLNYLVQGTTLYNLERLQSQIWSCSVYCKSLPARFNCQVILSSDSIMNKKSYLSLSKSI